MLPYLIRFYVILFYKFSGFKLIGYILQKKLTAVFRQKINNSVYCKKKLYVKEKKHMFILFMFLKTKRFCLDIFYFKEGFVYIFSKV